MEELSKELSKLKAEKAETDRQLLVEKNKVRALAEDVMGGETFNDSGWD